MVLRAIAEQKALQDCLFKLKGRSLLINFLCRLYVRVNGNNNNAVIDKFSLMALNAYTQYPGQTLAPGKLYYQHHFLENIPARNEDDQNMTFIVRDGTDLLLFAQSAARFWKSAGNCPYSFKGTVRTRKGNCFATFDYLAEK